MADGETPRGAKTAKKSKKTAPTASRKSYRPGAFDLVVKRATAGLGLFAGEAIPKGACVIEYVGVVLSEEDYQKSRSVYLFDIGPRGALDGSPRWNRARYINHSCRPNCDPTVRRRRVFIHALRNIAAGEELTYDYGVDYFDANIGPNCRCCKCRPISRIPEPRKAVRSSKKGAKSAPKKR